MAQYNLNFSNNISYTKDNYLVSECNRSAFDFLFQNKNKNNFIYLFGPNKSGKTHLSSIWCEKNKCLKLEVKKFKIENLYKLKKNILIDDIFKDIDEEKIFHLINHCKLNNLKILMTSNILPKNYKFIIEDLSSRIKSFYFIEIYKPDDYLISNLIVKLFSDRQIKVKNYEVVNYLALRIDRSFENLNFIINKIDEHSLSYKREITIPLIKEII